MLGHMLCLLLPLGFASFSIPTLGVEVSGIYEGSVPVDSRDDARERNRAFGDAMRQVLVKVTGNREVLSHAMTRRAISNADDYVDTWSYRTINPDADSEGSIELNVSFFEPKVLELIDLAGIPMWPKNRPYTLLWIVVQDELEEKQLLGTSSDTSDILVLLHEAADARGLPLLLPLLDIDDLRAVSIDDVWNMNIEKLLEASARYQSESILLVRIFRTLGGDVLGKSTYMLRDQALTLEAFEEPLESFVSDSIALSTNELSAYYAILLSGTQSNLEVRLTVEGIEGVEDYAGLLNYVSELADVNSFKVVSVDNQTIELALSTGGQIRQLVETIALNRNMLPVSEVLRDENNVTMSYRWIAQ